MIESLSIIIKYYLIWGFQHFASLIKIVYVVGSCLGQIIVVSDLFLKFLEYSLLSVKYKGTDLQTQPTNVLLKRKM